MWWTIWICCACVVSVVAQTQATKSAVLGQRARRRALTHTYANAAAANNGVTEALRPPSSHAQQAAYSNATEEQTHAEP